VFSYLKRGRNQLQRKGDLAVSHKERGEEIIAVRSRGEKGKEISTGMDFKAI